MLARVLAQIRWTQSSLRGMAKPGAGFCQLVVIEEPWRLRYYSIIVFAKGSEARADFTAKFCAVCFPVVLSRLFVFRMHAAALHVFWVRIRIRIGCPYVLRVHLRSGLCVSIFAGCWFYP